MKKRTILLFFISLIYLTGMAQMPKQMPSKPDQPQKGMSNIEFDSWQVSVNPMDPRRRGHISSLANDMQAQGNTRSVFGNILQSMGYGGVSASIDVLATEIINLAKMREKKKQQWMQMIQNECNYTDSISSIKGIKDFYLKPSRYDALDPSDLNFDGVTIRGMRNNEEVVYILCHIDTTKLDHIFQHSKFNLVVDSISFNPFACHLPNLSANGIRIMKEDKNGRNNKFSFSERNHLTIGMELTITSSWINEAVMIQKDVKLGTFKLNVQIPDSLNMYHYSRSQIDKNRDLIKNNPSLRNDPHNNLQTEYIEIEGDCFMVPRSYMPLSGTERMWGTGEYNIKVKFREQCQFSQNTTYNEKLKHWNKDYKQLRKMQHRGNEVNEYFKTLWKQNGDNITKSIIKQGLNSGAQAANLTQSGGNMSAGGAPGGNNGGGNPPMGN